MIFSKMLVGFMPEKGTIDAVLILIGLQAEYRANGKSCIYIFCGS